MGIQELMDKESSLKQFEIDSVLKVEYAKKQNLFRVYLKTSRLLDGRVREPIGEFLSRITGQSCDTSIIDILGDCHHENIQDVLMGIFLSEPLKYNFLKDAVISLEDDKLIIRHYSSTLIRNFKTKDALKHMDSVLKSCYEKFLNIDIRLDESLTPVREEIDVRHELNLMRKEAGIKGDLPGTSAPVGKPIKPSQPEQAKAGKKQKDENILLGKPVRETSVRIKDLEDNSGLCVIDG